MSEIEIIPNWIYTFLLLPIIVLYQKHFSMKNKVTKIETTQEFYTKKVDKICESNEKLVSKIDKMLGEWDEHKRHNSS